MHLDLSKLAALDGELIKEFQPQFEALGRALTERIRVCAEAAGLEDYPVYPEGEAKVTADLATLAYTVGIVLCARPNGKALVLTAAVKLLDATVQFAQPINLVPGPERPQ